MQKMLIGLCSLASSVILIEVFYEMLVHDKSVTQNPAFHSALLILLLAVSLHVAFEQGKSQNKTQ